MMIGERVRQLRKGKQLTQGDIEKRTGMRRCYLSRIENGHTIPTIETLEKIALGLEVLTYELFHNGSTGAEIAEAADDGWPASEPMKRYWCRLRTSITKMQPGDRRLLLDVARRTIIRKRQNRNSLAFTRTL
jgi:transcriptional regulator with XRE-family HTH domain